MKVVRLAKGLAGWLGLAAIVSAALARDARAGETVVEEAPDGEPDDAPPAALSVAPRRPEDREVPRVPAATPAAPAAAVDPADEVPPAQRLELDIGIRVFALVDVAALPKPAPGLGAGGAAQRDAWRGELFAAYFPEQTKLTTGGAGADVSFMLAVARGCWVPLRRRFEVGVCLGGEAGIERAVAFGVDDPGSGSAVWLAPQAAVVGHLHITPVVAGFAAVDLAVPLAKERFVLVGVGDVHGAPDVTGRLALGIDVGP